MIFTKEELEDAAKFSNFCQAFKMELWEKHQIAGTPPLNEEILDRILLDMWNKYCGKLE